MIITQTPLRISLAGGGTDFPAYYEKGAGAVLSSAIDKYVYVIVNQRFDDKIVVGYTRKETVDTVDEIRHELVREAMRRVGITRGIEIATMADIPSQGSGLGSSSSVTVGLLNAFYQYQGRQVTAEQLARDACEIEIARCGKPIGKQDQYIAAYGGMQFFTFQPDGEVEAEPVPLAGGLRHKLSERMLLFFTDVTRKADPILDEQQQRTEANRGALDAIRDLARRLRTALHEGDFDAIGPGLAENWQLKKHLAGGISTPHIEEMVQKAMSGGATGCKVSGAGGGGFLLTYCPHGTEEPLRRAMAGYREMPFHLERVGSKVIFNIEGYEWK